MKKLILAGLAALALAVGYVGFHGGGPWAEPCVEYIPLGADGYRDDWTWLPPGWDCVYIRVDEHGRSHDIARRRVR